MGDKSGVLGVGDDDAGNAFGASIGVESVGYSLKKRY